MSKTTSATVKVMLSHNYCHFEVSKVVETTEGEDLSMNDIDAARIECQKLADKAVDQYKKAKDYESRRANNSFEKSNLEREVASIRLKDEKEWSPLDKAKVKALEDHNFESRFYRYEDDDEDYGF